MVSAFEHFQQGSKASSIGLFDRAIDCYDQALLTAPNELKIMIHFNYGIALWKRNDFQKFSNSAYLIQNAVNLSKEQLDAIKEIQDTYQKGIDLYENMDENTKIQSELPIHQTYEKLKKNRNVCGDFQFVNAKT